MGTALAIVTWAALGGVALWGLRAGRTLPLFAWVAVVFTHPLLFSPGALPANAPAPQDAWLFLWDLWWVKTALAAGQSPLETELLFAPHGTTLVYHGLALTQALLTLPLQLLRGGLEGAILAYVAVVWLSFTLAGWAAERLAFRVTGDRAGAIFCGLAFTLSSLHFASTVRFHALAIEWLPLCLLALLRVFERGRVRDGVGLGLAFVAAFYAAKEYAYFVVLASAIVGVFELLHHRERLAGHGWLGRSALGFAVTLLLTAPYWLAFSRESALTHETAAFAQHAAHLSPDLLDVVLPHPNHPWLGEAVAALRSGWGLREAPIAVGMAWTLLGLGAWGGWRALRGRERELWPYVALAVFFAAAMLGPAPRWLGEPLPGPMPFDALARALPFFEQARMPMRFSAVATLALGVLAASVLARVAHGTPRRRRLVLAGVFGALAFECLRVPLAMEPVQVPAAFRAVGGEVGEGILIDWPPGAGATAEIEGLHQIVHGQRLVQPLPLFLPRAARETRATAEGAELARLLQGLFGLDGLHRRPAAERAEAIASLQALRTQLDVRYVALRRGDVPPAVWRHGRANLAALGPERVFDDGESYLAAFE